MASEAAKLITVFGATGSQGGNVARALAANAAFKVRAVTRNPDSDKAKALPAGVEVVKADLEDAESIAAAVAGAHGVFLVTDTWGILPTKGGDMEATLETEIAQGKRVVDACKAAGVKHLVYSGLEDVEAATEGALKVPHFDGKGRIAAYARASGVPLTEARYSFYLDNWLGMMAPRLNAESGKYEIALPLRDVGMGVISVEDAGHAVAAMFAAPDATIGKVYGLANEVEPLATYAAAISRVTGKEVTYVDVPDEAFLGMMGPDFTNMCIFYRDLEKCVRSPEETRALYGGLRSVEAWLEANKEALLAKMA